MQYPRSTGHTRLISPIASGAPQILRKDTGTLTRSSVPASRSSVPGTMSVSLYLFKPGCRKDTGTRKRYRDTDSEQATDTQRGDQAAASAYPRVGASCVCARDSESPSPDRRLAGLSGDGDSESLAPHTATETPSLRRRTTLRRGWVEATGSPSGTGIPDGESAGSPCAHTPLVRVLEQRHAEGRGRERIGEVCVSRSMHGREGGGWGGPRARPPGWIRVVRREATRSRLRW